MSHKIDFFMISIMFLFTTNVLAGIGSCVFIVFYVSKLKVEIVDVKYQGKWVLYFKSVINLKKKLK